MKLRKENTAMKTTQANKNAKHGFTKQLISGIFILLLLVIALLTHRDSLSDILKGITEVSPASIAVSALLSTLFFIMEGCIICKLAACINPAYKFKDGIATAYRCEFYRLITFGSGTGIAEIHYLHQKGIEPAAGTGISILQFTMKKIGVAILGIISFLLLYRSPDTKALCRDYTVFLTIGCIVTVAIALFLFSITLSDRVMAFVLWIIDKLSDKFPSFTEKLASLKKQVYLLNESGHTFLHKKLILIQVVLFNLMKLTAIYCIPAYLLRGKCDIGFIECTALMAAVYILAGVIPAPSGIGSLEFIYLLLFGVLAEPETTVPTLLVFRFVTWILPFIIGGILCLAGYCKSLRS